ncbi:MAG: efflux RND transporter periplasmic adaptor subunit [Acidobacteriota bacterium]
MRSFRLPESLRPITRGRWMTLGLVLTTAAIVTVASLASTSPSPSPSASPPTDEQALALPVLITTLDAASGYTVRRAFVGRVEARRSSRVGFELDGRIATVVVDEGAPVEMGDVLATLDTARLQARRATLEAARDQAEAAVALAEATHARVTSASALDAVSSQALDEAALGLQARRAALDQARAAVGQLDVELAKSRLIAPFDAHVVDRFTDEGQVVDAGTPVVELVERRRPEARIGVAGDVVDSLAPDQSRPITIGGRVVDGTIRTVLPTRDPSTRTVEVVVDLEADLDADAGDHALRVGDLAHLHLETEVASVGFWLPRTALTESRRGLWAAYVVAGDASRSGGTLERREVEVLHEESERVYVRGALATGERVVVDGLHRLVPGLAVRTVEKAAS